MKSLSHSINNLNNRFWAAIVRSSDMPVQSLAVLRIIVGLALLTIYTFTFGWIGQMPQAFFDPPTLSPVNFLADGFPSGSFFLTMDLLILASAVCITLGIKPKIAALIYIVASLTCFNFQVSFGKIGHSIFLYVLLATMSFSGWGTKLALWPDKVSRQDSTSRTLALLGVLLCFAFFSAGSEKAVGWVNLDFHTSGSARWYYNSFYNLGRPYFLAPYVKHLPFFVFKLMDITAVIFEFSPLLCLLHSRKAWRLFLLVACSFHIVNALFFNISFIVNGVVYLAYVDFSGVYNYIQRVLSKPAVAVAAGAVVLLIVYVRAVNILALNRTGMIFLPADPKSQLFGVFFFWLIIGSLMAYNAVHSEYKPKPAEAA